MGLMLNGYWFNVAIYPENSFIFPIKWQFSVNEFNLDEAIGVCACVPCASSGMRGANWMRAGQKY